ncbi:3193_t:CDS:2 [Paraglomus brasilianum]|uniref:Elongator complex protein 4 n=1 Tax=Paraglomus brasilianum TaxID=144538 RepID=A0A9N8WSS8_9GLOM|nr:3193_t:CDS:2 [Paraglomus brasilianum]
MAIAWRYKGLGRFESGVPTGKVTPSMTLSKQLSKTDAPRPFCNTFDLTKTIPESIIGAASLSLLDINNIIEGSGDTRLYDQILQKIRTMMKEKGLSNIEASDASEQVNTLRICIESIDSPGWPPQRPGEVFKFFHALRGLLRSSNAAAVITMPAHLYSDDSQDVVRRIEHMSDAVIELDSFAARPGTADTAYSQDYHGLFYVHKLPVINSLVSPSTKLSILLGSGHSNLGFKLRRKKFSIETFHLPPEGGVSERRTGPNKQKGTGEAESKIAGKVASVGCGSLPGKTDLYEF